ncbi:hypothetical protein FRB97_005865 [Tulasnella sp. 331]|nr:hypothetical protein FRB97_005865 [Tulasnella sp. 331]
MSSILPTPTLSVTFAGVYGEDISFFLQNIQQEAFKQGRQREDAWIADYALTMLRGRALIWYYSLDEESQSSWRKLRVALIARFSPPDDLQPPPGPSQAPTPAASSTIELTPLPELNMAPPEYAPKDPLTPISPTTPTSSNRPNPPRHSLTVPRHTHSMSTSITRPQSSAAIYAHHARSESTVSRQRPSTGYAPSLSGSIVPTHEVIVPLIPARRGYIKLVTSKVGAQQAEGYISGKRWSDIKKSPSKAIYVEIPPFWTSYQAPWEMKIINPQSGLQEGRQVFHVRGPPDENSLNTGFGWSFGKDLIPSVSKHLTTWRNCWVINGTPGEEELSIMWKYKDGREDILTIWEKKDRKTINPIDVNYRCE